VVSFQGVVIGMKPGCERRPGGSEPKKKKRALIGQRGGQAWLGCSKKATWKQKQAVSKESEGRDSLPERTENRRKVR